MVQPLVNSGSTPSSVAVHRARFVSLMFAVTILPAARRRSNSDWSEMSVWMYCITETPKKRLKLSSAWVNPFGSAMAWPLGVMRQRPCAAQ
jgi:hypothetical protein